MYDDFKKYLKEHKRMFNIERFNEDQMYRAVCFGQFGRRYKYDRKNKPNDFDDLEWEIEQYHKRIKENDVLK